MIENDSHATSGCQRIQSVESLGRTSREDSPKILLVCYKTFMQALPEQLAAYRLWLQDRGQRYSSAPAPKKNSATAPAPHPRPSELSVVFLGDGRFADDERALLVKMIAAMNLTGEFAIVDDAEAWLADPERRSTRLTIALGSKATAVLMPTAAFQEVRGRFDQGTFGLRVLPTLHPRDLLRQPADKRVAWTDLQLAMGELSK